MNILKNTDCIYCSGEIHISKWLKYARSNTTIWREWLMLVEMLIVGLCLYIFDCSKHVKHIWYITCLLINMFAISGWKNMRTSYIIFYYILQLETKRIFCLDEDWKKKLETILRKCNKYCLKLGMGREIFSLEWGDINCDFSWIIIIQLISHIY